MADDLELLLKIKADAEDAKRVIAGLREQYGRDFTQLGKLGEGAMRGINQEIVGLSRSIPVLGRPIAGITQAFLSMRPPLTQVNDEVRKLTQASSLFESAIVKAFSGGSHQARELATTFERLGIDLDKGIRAPQGAFATFIQSFRAIPNEADRAALAVEVFGAKATQLLPALEGVAAESTAAGAGIAGIAGPIGLAVAGFALLTGGAALLVGGLFKATNSAAEYGSQIWDAHIKTGVAVESLTGYYVAAQKAKVPFEQFAVAIARVERSAVEAEKGSRKYQQAFADIGVSTKTVLTDTTKFIDEFSKRMGNLPNGAQKVDEAFQLVSRSGVNMIPAFDAARKGVDSLIEEAKRLGLFLTESQARDFKAYQISVSQMQASLKGLEFTIGKSFAPTAREVILSISSLVQVVRPVLQGVFEFVGGQIKFLIDYQLKPLIATIETMPAVLNLLLTPTRVIAKAFADLGETAKHTGLAILYGLTGNTASASIEAALATQASLRVIATAANEAYDAVRKVGQAYAANRAALDVAGPEIPEGGTEGADLHGTGKSKKENDKARQEALRQLEEANKDIEREYKNQTEALQREYKLQLTSLEEFTDKSIAEEEKRFTKRRDILLKERALAKEPSEVDKYDRELAAAQDEKDRNIQKQKDERDQKEIDSLKEHRQALLKLGEEYDKRQIDSVNALADARKITYEEAEEKVLEIETKAFKHRLQLALDEQKRVVNNVQLFRKANDEVKRITEEQVTVQEQAERRISAAREKDLNSALNLINKLYNSEKQYEAQSREFERAELLRLYERNSNRALIIARLAELDLQEEDSRYRKAKAEIDAEEKEAKALAKTSKEKLAIQEEYNARREQEDKEHEQRNREIMRSADVQTERNNPASGRSLFGDSFADGYKAYVEAMRAMGKEVSNLKATLAGLANTASDVFRRLGDEAGNFTSSAVEAFQSLQNSLRGAIESYVELGTVGGFSLRKLLTEMAAHFAGAWGMKAIDLLAESFADAAKASAAAASGNWIGAVLYKKAASDARHAALIYGAASIGSAVAGRFIAGGSGSGGGSGTAEGTGSTVQYAPFTYSNNSGIPASQAYGAGSRNLADAINNLANEQRQTNAHLATFQPVDAGYVVGMGSERNPTGVANGVRAAIQESHPITRDITSLATNGTTSHA